MNRLLLSSLALTVLAGSAFAQQPPAPPPGAEPPVADQQLAPPPPPGGPDAMNAPRAPRDLADAPRRGPGHGEFGLRGHRPPPPPPPSKAAHFRIEDGDTKIDIKCADDEPTKACADLLLQVIDKLGSPSSL
ncbi:hypothetical protein [Rhizobium sp. 18055]|jgi:hypothetical protein|uniref:hypothetical protein n=1 Tax=Rhizobium sp. 18055 TaxID=2681403 RepID=UPI00135BAC55|nr:hypothetical protein [Rhizobium sp. 18055]